MSVDTPKDVCWPIHRVATSERYCSSLLEVQTQWSLDDLMDAIEVLDMYDVLTDRAAAKSRGDEVL